MLYPPPHLSTIPFCQKQLRSLLIGNLKFCFFLFSDQLLHFFPESGNPRSRYSKWCFIFFLDPYHLTSAQHKKKHCQTQQRSCFFHKFSHFPVLDFFSMYSMQSIKHLLQSICKNHLYLYQSLAMRDIFLTERGIHYDSFSYCCHHGHWISDFIYSNPFCGMDHRKIFTAEQKRSALFVLSRQFLNLFCGKPEPRSR